MNAFEPGEGWREVPHGEPKSKPNMRITQPDGSIHWYEREVPVPPLPTVPYTVIRATWKDGYSPAEVLTLVGDMWGDFTAGNLGRNITGFEVLAEPLTAQKREDIAAEDERVKAWHKVVSHPLIQPCFGTKTSLIDAMLQLFDRLAKADSQAATLDAALDRAESFLDQAWTPGTMRILSYDLQQALFAAIRDGAKS